MSDNTKFASVVIVRRDNLILLGKRLKRYGFGQYQLPGGLVEPHETHEQAAVRELEQETGLKAKHLKYVSNFWRYDEEEKVGYFNFAFEVTDFEGEPRNLEPNKCAGWEWFPLWNLPEPLFECYSILTEYSMDFI